MNVLEWLIEHGAQPSQVAILGEAASGGHIGALEWGDRSGCDLRPHLYANAARAGQLGVLAWLAGGGVAGPGRRELCEAAAEGRSLEAMRWVADETCRSKGIKGNVYGKAARRGHLDVMIWLSERGHSLDSPTRARARARPRKKACATSTTPRPWKGTSRS